MPRGAKGAKPAKAKVEAKLPVARTSPKTEGSRVGNLEKRLAALKQEEATGEMLRVIGSSPPTFGQSLPRSCAVRRGCVVVCDVDPARPRGSCPASSPRGLAGSPPAAGRAGDDRGVASSAAGRDGPGLGPRLPAIAAGDCRPGGPDRLSVPLRHLPQPPEQADRRARHLRRRPELSHAVAQPHLLSGDPKHANRHGRGGRPQVPCGPDAGPHPERTDQIP